MRPDIGDILTGIQRTFMEDILPALSSPYAREQASYLLLLLEHCQNRWDRVHPFLRQEHEDLRLILQRIVEEGMRVGEDEELSEASVSERSERVRAGGEEVVQVIGEIEKRLAIEGERQGEDIQLLRERNEAMRELVARFVRALETGDAGSSPALKRARKEVHAYMKRQLEREREWVKVGEITW